MSEWNTYLPKGLLADAIALLKEDNDADQIYQELLEEYKVTDPDELSEAQQDEFYTLGRRVLGEKYLGFAKLEKKIASRGGVKNPGAVAAAIGRKKYGKKKFQNAAAHDHKLKNEEPTAGKELEHKGGKPAYTEEHSDEKEDKELVKKMVKPDALKEEGLDENVTRKHFQQVADLIKTHKPEHRNALAKHHADIFATMNPRFDHNRFYKAAGATLKHEDSKKK